MFFFVSVELADLLATISCRNILIVRNFSIIIVQYFFRIKVIGILHIWDWWPFHFFFINVREFATHNFAQYCFIFTTSMQCF